MKIAIQGHPTRGKEVIQILESLGGENRYDQSGSNEKFVYFIDNIGFIYSVTQSMCSSERRIYTLEEFEKEFPFKIGDEVIFPVTRGWLSGKIIGLDYAENQLKYKIHDRIGGYSYVEPHKLSLYPMKEERNITLTLDKAKEWYNKGGELKEIALQAFSEKELTKVELPKTWEEFCNNYSTKNGECYIGACSKMHILPEFDEGRDVEMDKNVCPSQKSAEAHLAMIQLEQLRDCWRQGWKPKWMGESEKKYAIKAWRNEYTIQTTYNTHEFLTFPTYEMAEEFLKYFRDLIEKAGDLI